MVFHNPAAGRVIGFIGPVRSHDGIVVIKTKHVTKLMDEGMAIRTRGNNGLGIKEGSRSPEEEVRYWIDFLRCSRETFRGPIAESPIKPAIGVDPGDLGAALEIRAGINHDDAIKPAIAIIVIFADGFPTVFHAVAFDRVVKNRDRSAGRAVIGGI